ncbi:MAG: hypothetical protein P8M50_02250 [Paracoccaceae bacterium]|nr:hypothetical protein [Paracoccaceae bacterium]
MYRKILSVVLVSICVPPCFGGEPNNAIEWFKEQKNTKGILTNNEITDEGIISLTIEKSNLKPTNLNSIGIIPTDITGIDPGIWKYTDESDLFNSLRKLPDLKFQSAQTFLKRILISETQPPISSGELNQQGRLYLLAKLDKLIKIGALDEAETTILQIPKIDSDLFERWTRIAFLTGRITKLCKELRDNSGLSKDLSLRIICLMKLNDWDAAALTLATAYSLEMIAQNRADLLIHYLDPKLIPKNQLAVTINASDEIDHFLINSNAKIPSAASDQVRYQYMIYKSNSSLENTINAAEKLVIKKSINASSLFDIYRNNYIDGSIGFWQRMIAVKNLDMTLKRNNHKAVSIALNKAIEEMHSANLLFLFAGEYADILSKFFFTINPSQFNDNLALVFALNGELPSNWKSYEPKNDLISMAISILRNDSLNASDVGDVIKLVNPNFNLPKMSKNRINYKPLKGKNESNDKGIIVLEALRKSAHGVNAPPEQLYLSFLLFLEANEHQLVKSILIEYLIYSSRVKS